MSATVLAGTLSTAAQGNVTSLGTLTALTVDDVAVNGKVITMTGSTDDTAVMTVGTNGTLTIETTDTAAAAANIQITADGTAELAGTTVTLDSGGAVVLDSATGIVNIQDGGSTVLSFTEGNSGDVTVKLETNGKDLVFTDNGDATNMKILDAAAGINVPGEVQTTGIGYTDGDNALTIADGGGVTVVQDLTISDGKGIIIDSTPSDDGYNGVFAVFTAGEAISAGEVVYHNSTANNVQLARANADSTMPAIAIAIADVSNGATGTFMLMGMAHDSSAFPTLTIGGEVYVSEDTAGAITSTLPASSGDRVQVIGIGMHADKMIFNPDYTIIERA